MAADQARSVGQEIPFRAGRFQYVLGVDAQPLEDLRQFVGQCDVDIALRIFDDLGGFGDANAAGLVCTGGDDAPIQRIDEIRRCGGRAGGDFQQTSSVAPG
jgi:hypothetical protein